MSYSAKRFKSFICAVLALVLVFGSVVVLPPQEVSAATKLTYQTKVRAGVGIRYSNSVDINFAKIGDTVKNVKFDKKALAVKKTRTYSRVDGTDSYSYVRFTFYAKKAGTHKIKFDIFRNGKKSGKTKTITVYAAGNGALITSAKINGKNVIANNLNGYSYTTTRKKDKVSFGLAKGAKITKVEVGKRDKNGKMNYKTVNKKGSTVTYGLYGYGYDNKYTSSYSNYSYNTWQRDYFAETQFRITYTDSYSTTPKAKFTTYYTINRPATKWYTQYDYD
jgi:hypothetical protein